MQRLIGEKKTAIDLRAKGYTYSEILQIVPVAKSSLSLWLKDMPIKREFKNYILGAKAKREQRIEKTKQIYKDAIDEIEIINHKELFYMGIMLYWAEGAKQRRRNISQGVDFSNSDPRMCKVFLRWLKYSLNIEDERISLYVYIHESQKDRADDVLFYWMKISEFPKEAFNKIYYTRTIYPRKKKRLDNGKYYGQLRVKVRKSTDLNRKIMGWIEGVSIRSNLI